MALFSVADPIVLCCSNLQAAKQFWIDIFEGKQVRVPASWDDQLPSDVALRLFGEDEPSVALSDRGEVERAGLSLSNGRPILFCSKLKKAQEYLATRGVAPGAIQESGGTEFFEIHDPEGNVIEICKEP